MSSTTLSPETFDHYRRDPVAFAETCLGLRLADTQRRIVESIRENRRTLIVSGNGVGKSYAVAAALLWWSLTHPDSVSLLTSGSYSMLTDTTWRPMKGLLKNAKHPIADATRALENPPRIEFPEDEWYFKAVSPTNPDGLEGRHNQDCLVVIEEADKPEIGPEHFDSAGSSVTDTSDRFVAVANPPRDETNVVAEKRTSDRWSVVEFDSFDSHNVVIEHEAIDADPIPGLVTLDLIREDYEAWNGEEWPGVEAARSPDGTEDARWFRRRLGRMPPASAAVHRPFYTDDARAALEENQRPADPGPPLGIGIDVARKGGDKTVYRRLYPDYTDAEEWSKRDHNDNEAHIRDLLDDEPALAPIAIDAVGEGSGLADRLQDAYPDVHRFKNGSKPETADGQREYYDKWTEGLAALGDRLSGLAVDQRGDTAIREELFAAARVITFEENRRRSGDVIQATPKADVKERLGHSPDSFDGLVMAAWAAGDNVEDGSGTPDPSLIRTTN